MPVKTSALAIASVPAMVAGPLTPALAPVPTINGWRQRACSINASIDSPLKLSGLSVLIREIITGRSLSEMRSPNRILAMSTEARAPRAPRTLPINGLLELSILARRVKR